ncbi:MAG TPA: cytochrome P450 [Acidimicrobiales bacterium]|nr:cytochrome P450 [Acidimicrobiales bacterium]
MTNDDLSFSPFDSERTHAMFPELRVMRDRCPVVRTSEGYFYVARYDDNQRMFRDARAWPNAGGWRESWVQMPDEDRFLGETDPPRHTDIRRPLVAALSPRMATNAEPFTRAYVRGRLDGLVARGGGDLVQELTLPLPQAVSAHVLGIPIEDIERVAAWCFELIHSTWPATNRTERGEGITGAFPEFAAYLDEQIAIRHAADPKPDDLMTRMLYAEDGTRRMTDWDTRTQSAGVLAASLSTTALIGNLFYRMMTQPEFEQLLRERRDLIPGAVEESLRLEPPVMLLFRTAAVEADVAGTRICPADRVVLGIASANRDERVYGPDAEEFRADRDLVPEHLSFGLGPHTCPGRNIARMEARVVLETYFDHHPPRTLELAEDFEFEFVPMFLEYGPRHLEVAVDAAATRRSRA